MITLLKPLKWSPDGCRIEIIEAGEHEELPARAIEIAEQIGILYVDSKPVETVAEQREQLEPEKTDKKAKK
ncbi:hypothetical protein [Escherichia coli]|uniref:hypothetical protein n=1 Tax=Escherichia coli TaxID=562 RepID=UPI0009428C93|nr:hypothetical protein [Escherichia coli]MCX3809134.1 hypothetical protein [Escherichia coli]OKV26783.1 hypothetical protein AWP49_22115 [Escherichia coli]OKX75295.1 hypothetical protein AWP95_04485 [Escherichia coli]HAP6013950.1 hypothetical protein [Escherichia coli]